MQGHQTSLSIMMGVMRSLSIMQVRWKKFVMGVLTNYRIFYTHPRKKMHRRDSIIFFQLQSPPGSTGSMEI